MRSIFSYTWWLFACLLWIGISSSPFFKFKIELFLLLSDRTQKEQATAANIDKQGCSKLKSFCTAKETDNRMGS